MLPSEEAQALVEAIRHLHGCSAIPVQRVEVDEHFGGATVWHGIVHIFAVDHPRTSAAYGWSYVVDEQTQRRKFIAVLGIPPVDSPVAAVRAAIASGQQG